MSAVKASRTNNKGMPTSSFRCIRLKKLRKKPSRKMRSVRVINLAIGTGSPSGLASTMETPTRNKKKGKTRSVGVQPCHLACSKGA